MTDSAGTTPTAEDALHATVPLAFEDAVLRVQLEHELAGFETVTVSRLDRLVEGTLGDEVARTATIVVCHPEVARGAIELDPRTAGLLPCTTVVYEASDGTVHAHHVSATKAIRDLGVAPGDGDDAVAALVERTGELMTAVWAHVEAIEGDEADGD